MYEFLLFHGGVYKFDELVEFIEDIGGMVLKKDQFDVIRGSSFLSEQINVLLMVPHEEIDKVLLKANEIKGRIEKLELPKDKKFAFFFHMLIYDILSRSGSWVELEKLKIALDCPCLIMFCEDKVEDECNLDRLNEILDDMCSSEILEYKVFDEGLQYRLREHNDQSQ
jgi:Methyl-coenzyme M reductase operon protein C